MQRLRTASSHIQSGLRGAAGEFHRRRILQSRIAARIFPFRQPPVLLLSYPRSGSSWVGDVLNTSPQIAYLREPVNQALLRHSEGTLIDPEKDEQTRRWFCEFADDAFHGLPPEGIWDKADPADFELLGRQSKRLLIKEVNPLAAAFFARRYAPQTILIVRHPAAVADSFQRRGWLTADWEQFGYEYGQRMYRALEALREVSLKVVQYEQIAIAPLDEFGALFSFLGLPLPADFDHTIRRFSHTRGSDNPYETRRISIEQVEKWKENLSSAAVSQVVRGYLRSDLQYYRDQAPPGRK